MALTDEKTRAEQKPPPAAPNGADFTVADILSGAPLDVVKLIAAVLMVVDHVNVVFLGHEANVLWRLGRIAFPLFAFALACNLKRGASLPDYIVRLLLIGAVAQPIYAAVLKDDDANTLFTLAVGMAIATALRSRPLWVPHAVFCAGVVAIFCPYIRVRAGLDFGLAGMLLPAALFMLIEGRRSHILWLAPLLVGLNWFFPDPWQFAPLGAALFAAIGAGAALLLAVAFKHRPRFLPRYAFYVFYPAHLLVLGTIHGLMPP